MNYQNFSREIIGDVIIESVHLKFATQDVAQRFRDRLLKDIEEGRNKMIIDFKECEFIDYSVIGAMVIVLRRLNEKGGELRLVIPQMDVFQVYTGTGLLSAFKLYRSLSDALKDF